MAGDIRGLWARVNRRPFGCVAKLAQRRSLNVLRTIESYSTRRHVTIRQGDFKITHRLSMHVYNQ